MNLFKRVFVTLDGEETIDLSLSQQFTSTKEEGEEDGGREEVEQEDLLFH